MCGAPTRPSMSPCLREFSPSQLVLPPVVGTSLLPLCVTIFTGLSWLPGDNFTVCLCVGESSPNDRSCSVFTPHPSQVVRHVNSCPLFVPFVKTQSHRCSFFVCVIAIWNSLPEEIVSLSTDLAFKRHLRQYLVV